MKTSMGRLIVFEGVDAAGKTTLSNELCSSLNRKCIVVRHCHFPGTRKGVGFTPHTLIYNSLLPSYVSLQ